jgi:hypothetical protein
MSGLLSTTCALPRIARRASCDLRDLVQLGELILRERLGRKQIERARRRRRQNRLQDRRVVAERLARRGRRRGDDVAAGKRVADGLGLVRIELRDPARGQRLHEARIHVLGERRELRLPGRQPPHRRDVQVVVALRLGAADPDRRLVFGQHPGQRGLQ